MKKGLVLLFVITILLSTIQFANAASSDIFEKIGVNIAEGGYVPAQIVVKFKLGVSDQNITELVLRHGCVKLHRSPFTETFVLEIPADKAFDGMLRRFRDEPVVEYAQPNYVCSAFMTPNDPYYSYQWNFKMIHMEQAWDMAPGGSASVVVAVLDTGVAYENYGKYKLAPDLAGTTFVPGYDFINNDAHPNDDNSHGTHVTGTIAQTTNNGIGVAGIAFNTAIMPVKVLGKSGSGTEQALADGIRWAADHGAHVISMSLGFDPGLEPADLPTLTSAVQYAYGKEVFLVAASGNDGGGVVSLPAAYPEVIAVGAVHSGGEPASYSQYGNALDFVAPGGDGVDRDGDGYADGVLQQTFDPYSKNSSDFGYWFFSGTSMATPHVSGVAALLIANGNADANRDGRTSSDEIMTVLQASAIDLGTVGRDDVYGWGLIDAPAALRVRTLTVNIRGGGSVTRYPDQTAYAVGTEVSLAAVSEAGWTFAGWSGDLSGMTNPNSILMDAGKIVTATFTPEDPVPLSGWVVDSSLTNAPYTLDSTESSLSLELAAVDANSRVTVYSLGVPSLDLGGFDHVDVAVTGTSNARVLLRFFMDNGAGFDIAYWSNPKTLDGISFDLSVYAGRTLTIVYVALTSSDGLTASIDISGIAFVVETPPPVVPLSGWVVDSSLTNAPYVLSSSASSLSFELDAVDINSRVTICTLGVPTLNLGDYDHIDVAVTGTANARILQRFFLDDGTGFDVVYWADPGTLDAISFDLGAYSGRTLTVAYIALMSSDGSTASVDITDIALVATTPPPVVPLSGWTVDPSLTNAAYTLSSTEISLSLELTTVDASSRVTIYTLGVPASDLGGFDHIDVAVTGTSNARVLLRFFLDDGTGLDVVYWSDPATLDAISFDLSAYAARTLTVGYVALMSSNGLDAGIDVTQIALVATAPPPVVPLAGWTVDASLTNAPYTLDSGPSLLSLDLTASDTSSRVTIYTLAVPTSDLGDFDHIDVAVTGTSNARVLLRFFLDDGSGFDVVYWSDPATLDAISFDLSPYAGRTLTVAYIALMSSDGSAAGIDINEIALVA
jgi:serine protease